MGCPEQKMNLNIGRVWQELLMTEKDRSATVVLQGGLGKRCNFRLSVNGLCGAGAGILWQAHWTGRWIGPWIAGSWLAGKASRWWRCRHWRIQWGDSVSWDYLACRRFVNELAGRQRSRGSSASGDLSDLDGVDTGVTVGDGEDTAYEEDFLGDDVFGLGLDGGFR